MHLFNKYLFTLYHFTNILLVTEDKIMNKSKQCPGFMKFTANIVDKH